MSFTIYAADLSVYVTQFGYYYELLTANISIILTFAIPLAMLI